MGIKINPGYGPPVESLAPFLRATDLGALIIFDPQPNRLRVRSSFRSPCLTPLWYPGASAGSSDGAVWPQLEGFHTQGDRSPAKIVWPQSVTMIQVTRVQWQYCGWTKSISHHFETMGNHCLLVFHRGSINLGFLRWCRISSIHSRKQAAMFLTLICFGHPQTQLQNMSCWVSGNEKWNETPYNIQLVVSFL